MNSKETKIQIDVKIGEERISMAIPFSQQDNVRRIESEIRKFLREQEEKRPGKRQSTYLAMAAYEFAKNYIRLKERYEKESDEAEDLLAEVSKILGKEDPQDDDMLTGIFGAY